MHSGSRVGCGEIVIATCHECGSTYARYVYVLIRGIRRTLMICELEVYTEGDYH